MAATSLTTGFEGLSPSAFLAALYCDMLESRRACAFMMRSMLADQPKVLVTRTQGEPTMRLETTTFSTLSPRISLVLAVLGVLLALLLLLARLLELKTLPGNADQLLALKPLEPGDGVLVDGVDHEQNLEALLLQALQEGRVADRSERLAKRGRGPGCSCRPGSCA